MITPEMMDQTAADVRALEEDLRGLRARLDATVREIDGATQEARRLEQLLDQQRLLVQHLNETRMQFESVVREVEQNLNNLRAEQAGMTGGVR